MTVAILHDNITQLEVKRTAQQNYFNVQIWQKATKMNVNCNCSDPPLLKTHQVFDQQFNELLGMAEIKQLWSSSGIKMEVKSNQVLNKNCKIRRKS